MIDTQRIGALLRALIRDDTITSRLRTPATAAVRPTAPVGPELPPPLAEETTASREVARVTQPGTPAAPREQEVPRDTVRIASRLAADLPAALAPAARDQASSAGTRRPDAQQVDARAAPQPGAPATTSAALELSDTGRALLAALRGVASASTPTPIPGSAMQPVSGASPGGARGPVAQALASRSPLISVPPHSEVATDRLALQLKDAVEFSGLFYESHLAQWADEMRPRALLAHEPQSRWPVAADIAQQVVAADAAPPDYATPVLRQQLEVLDTGRFVWRGELWPGQPGTLVIEEDEAPPQRAGILDEPTLPRWRMRLSLDFRELGAIDASVALCGESVDLGLHCADPGIVERLRAAAPSLRVAIAERALDLATLAVTHDDRA